jgi:hypothetical protein
MTIHATLETRAQTLTSLVLCEILVAGSVVAAAAHHIGSSIVVFAVMEHLVSASSTVAIASEIGGATFASVSAFGSSAVA